jgi:hypothetical protein
MAPPIDYEGYLPANGHSRWNQSFYFNAYDPRSRVGCFIRFGFMENLDLSNCWCYFFRDGKPLFQRINANLPYTPARLTEGVELAGLRVKSVDPLKRARITLDDPDFAVDLTWEAAAPLMDSIALTAGRAGDGSFEREIASAHWEGPCHVSGIVTLRGGERIEVAGNGARDLAAGPRDWNAMRHYRLAMPIFEDGLTVVGIHGISDAGKDAYMKMLHDGLQWHGIEVMEDHVEFDADDMTAQRVKWVVSVADGRSWTIRGENLFRCFIPVDTFMLAEHMMKFVRDDGEVGYGLVECGYRFPWSGNGN